MKDIKITDAAYFPQPQAIYKQWPIERAMGKAAAEYMRAWEHNGLFPSYDDLTRIKRDFIGEDKKAVLVLPEKENHVNIHDYCLHLFYSAENPLPEFSAGMGTI